jgi:hypothetical protein
MRAIQNICTVREGVGGFCVFFRELETVAKNQISLFVVSVVWKGVSLVWGCVGTWVQNIVRSGGGAERRSQRILAGCANRTRYKILLHGRFKTAAQCSRRRRLLDIQYSHCVTTWPNLLFPWSQSRIKATNKAPECAPTCCRLALQSQTSFLQDAKLVDAEC